MSETKNSHTIPHKTFLIKSPRNCSNSNQDDRFAFLDILRFCGAFIVAFAHIAKPDIIKNFPIFYGGASGVIIFFLISGYIMPHAILKSRNIKNFLINRCIRIYPLLIITATYGLLICGDHEIIIENIILLILGLMLPINDFIGAPYIARGVDWSLRIEFIFYILIAIIYFKKTFNLKNIIFCMLLFSAFGIINYFNNHKYFDWRFILINFILVGSLLYLIEKENFSNLKNNFLTLFALIFCIYIFEIFKVGDFNSLPMSIFASIFFMIFYFIHQTKFRIKSNKFITFLGDISYPSYLLHLMIYKDLYDLSNSYIATSIIFIAICFAVNFFIEKPIINWLKKIQIKNQFKLKNQKF